MLGIQTRLRLTPEQDALLGVFLGTIATLARTAYQRVNTGKLAPDPKAVYAWATHQGLTAHQAKSVVNQVDAWRTTDQALLDHRLDTLRLRIDALERVVSALDRKLNATAAKPSKGFLGQDARDRLSAKRFQKHRSLCNKRQQLVGLTAQRQSGTASRVFGSRRLLAQRHRLGNPDSPWTDASWRQEWERKRARAVPPWSGMGHARMAIRAYKSSWTRNQDRMAAWLPPDTPLCRCA